MPLPDGRVLIAGGQELNPPFGRLRSAEVYDPATETFTPLPNMAVEHGMGHTATLLQSGKVLILGGRTGQTAAINPTAVAELFDPATNTFTSAGEMTPSPAPSTAPSSSTTALSSSSAAELRTSPGVDLASTAEIYNPATNTFTQVAAPPLPGLEWTPVFLSKE
ncbi:MAG TPA: kelch repeat-containing protein [Longimicrobiales bacterium]|nr:kelch repeat-containing protein [Longimicrobiales bacterium]